MAMGEASHVPSPPAPDESAADAHEAAVRTAFRNAMRCFASTVSIISVQSGSERHGTTATAVTSVSLDPPSLLVCINQDSRLHAFLRSEARFCVNFLHVGNLGISRGFSSAMSSAERFAHGDWRSDRHGIPYLADAQASLFCVKEVEVPYGSHTVFIGRVFDARVRNDVCPLLYGNGAYTECTGLDLVVSTGTSPES
jgi:flavin reductase (DIM6/NTAB) family NADH-FMN oxidoreductase RutF